MAVSDLTRSEDERDQPERAARDREELYDLLTEHTNDFIRLHDLDGRGLYTSPSVERLYGRIPTTLFEFAHLEDVAACERWWKKVLAGETDRLRWRVRDASGNWRWLETTPALVQYHNRRHVLTVCRDLTEQRRAEEALRRSEADLAEAQRVARIGSWSFEIATNRVRWSEELYRIFEVEKTDAEGAPESVLAQLSADHSQGLVSLGTYEDFFSCVHPDDRARVRQVNTEASANGKTFEVEYRIRTSSGHLKHICEVGHARKDKAGVVLDLFGTAQDITARKEAEQAQWRSERDFSALAEKSLQGIAIFQDQKIVYANHAQAAILGYPIDELKAMSREQLIALTHPLDRPIAEERARKREAGAETPPAVEVRIVRKDGVTRWIQAFNNYIEFAGRLAVLSTSIDITERKQAEEALRESERKLAEAQRITHVGHWEWDTNADRLTASDETYRILGLSPQESLGFWEAWQEHVHPEDRVKRAAAIDRALREEAHYEAEYRVIRPDGDVRIIQSEGEVMRDGTGRSRGLFGVVRDVTEQRRAEEAQRAAERRLHHVVASSPAVLFTLQVQDGEFRGIDWMSENVEAMLGYRFDEALGEDWWLSNIHPEDRNAVVQQFRAEILSRGYFAAEYRFRHQDGQYHWIRGETRLLRGAAGQPTEVVGSLSDITARKRLEEQFRQAQKMEAIGTLAGGVAHDFNNLLTVINGYSDLLLNNLKPGDPMRALLAEIHKAGERAGSLTRQLLAFSRQQLLEPKVLNLNAVVADTEKMLQRLIGEDVVLSPALDPSVAPVKADPGQLEQVLMNLSVNARDAMPQGGRLTIETRNVLVDEAYAAIHPDVRPGKYVMLAVSDTGTGMDPPTKARIFEPFFTTKAPGKGTGLGLAVVHGIVKQSGGHVEVYSEVGKGTAFKIYLPVVKERVSTGHSVHGLRLMPRGTETLLLVEDEDALRALARHILRSCGYTVLEAADGREAIRVAEGHPGPIDLLVSDVVMPHLGGRQLAEQLAAVKQGMKVLFLSGYTDDAVVRHGVLEAEFAFLQKPFTPPALAQKVREVLDKKE